MTVRYIIGDTRDVTATMPDGSVDLVLTSPPFLALRSYLPADHPDKHREIGSEATPAAFLDTLLELTAEWGRVLAPHGTLAVELGDTYSGSGGGGGDYLPGGLREGQQQFAGSAASMRESNAAHWRMKNQNKDAWPLAKSKALIPELYRIALAYGINPLTGQPSPAGRWRVRNVVTWCRPNPPVGALGDKFRPATSDMVIACRASDRWFDLDAVRTINNPDRMDEIGTATPYLMATHETGVTGKPTNAPQHPAGAPPLDYWVIPPGGYAGSHYAVYPPELCRIPIEAMCPRQVCTVCGRPRRRIVETEYEPHGDPAKQNAEPRAQRGAEERGVNGSAAQFANGRATRHATTLGWTDCGHGSLTCRTCGVVVPSSDAVRRPRNAPSSQSQICKEGLLGQSIESTRGPSNGAGNVRGVRDRVHGQAGSALLHPELFSEAGAHRRANEQHRWDGLDPSEVDGWPEEKRGVRADLGPADHPGPDEERVHDGAPSSDAESHRTTSERVGDSSSPQRREGRQPHPEPRDRDAGAALGDGSVSTLSGDVRGQLTCPHCACELSYVEDHYRNGIVFDPFGGSGTTGMVATGLGRDAILIDIDERNADLARERIGMFLEVEDARRAA